MSESYVMNKFDDILTRDVMDNLLYAERLSVSELSERFKTDNRVIYSYIDRYNIDTRTIKNNEIILYEDRAEVILTNGEITLIDLDDVEEVKKYTWRHVPAGNRDLYHATMSYRDSHVFMGGKDTKLHRFIMNPEHNKIVVDHINHNSLDNRKQNLRLCTNRENLLNRRPELRNEVGMREVRYKNGRYEASIVSEDRYYYK